LHKKKGYSIKNLRPLANGETTSNTKELSHQLLATIPEP